MVSCLGQHRFYHVQPAILRFHGGPPLIGDGEVQTASLSMHRSGCRDGDSRWGSGVCEPYDRGKQDAEASMSMVYQHVGEVFQCRGHCQEIESDRR